MGFYSRLMNEVNVMLAILDMPFVGFLVVMLGALFLFSELFVRAKGIFFVIGIILFTAYFFHFITSTSMLWLAIVFVIGLSLVIIDGAFIGDGTLTAVGLFVMGLSVAVPAPSILYGVVSVFGLAAGFGLALLFLKVMKPRNMWKKMALKDKLTSEDGYNSLNERYLQLVGKEGITKTVFRPTGTVEIEGETYSAVTEGLWLEKDTPVLVVKVDGTKIVVKPKK